jgi:TATA-box binding protein (TBP) (component of TFIID and TFIIIB)
MNFELFVRQATALPPASAPMKLENTVLLGQFNRKFSLTRLERDVRPRSIRNVRSLTKGVIVSYGRPKAIVFCSGGLIMTGAPTPEAYSPVIEKLLFALSRHRMGLALVGLHTVNMVGTRRFASGFNVGALARANNETAKQRAKRERGIKGFKLRVVTGHVVRRGRVRQAGVAAVVFPTGTMIIVGPRTRELMEHYNALFSSYLAEFESPGNASHE